MLFGRYLRWACDAREFAVLREADAAARTLRIARRDAGRLYDVLLGDGPSGPTSWNVLQHMIPAYKLEVVPIHLRADNGRRRLGSALRLCRALHIPRWQVRLALL